MHHECSYTATTRIAIQDRAFSLQSIPSWWQTAFHHLRPSPSQKSPSSQSLHSSQFQLRSYAAKKKRDWTDAEIREYLRKRLSPENFQAWEEQQALSDEQKLKNETENVKLMQYKNVLDKAILTAEDDLQERTEKMKEYMMLVQLINKPAYMHPNSVANDPMPVSNHDPRNAISFEKDFSVDFTKEDINDPKFKPIRIELGLESPSRETPDDIYAPRLAKASRTRTFAMAQSREEQQKFEERSYRIRDLPPIEHFYPLGVSKDTDPKTLPALNEMPPFWPVIKHWKTQQPSEESIREYAKREGLSFEKMKQLSDLGLIDIELMKMSLGDDFKTEQKEDATETEQFSDQINKMLYHGVEKVNDVISVESEWKLDEWYEWLQYMHGVAQNAERLARADQNFRIAKRFRKPVVFDRDFDYDAGKPFDQQRPPGWEEPKVVHHVVKEEKPHREIEDLAVRLHECNIEVQRNPQDAVAFLRRAMLLYDMDKLDESIGDFTRAIELKHWNPELKVQARYFRGLAWDELGQFEEALKAYNEVIELDPVNQDAFVSRSLLYSEEFNDHKRGLEDLDRAIAIDNEAPMPWLHRARLFFTMGEYKEALSDTNMFVSLSPENSDGYLLRGNIYEKLNKLDKAVEDFTTLIEVDQSRLDVGVHIEDTESWTYRGYYNRSIIYAKQLNLRNAISDITTVLQRAPSFEPAIKLRDELSKHVTAHECGHKE